MDLLVSNSLFWSIAIYFLVKASANGCLILRWLLYFSKFCIFSSQSKHVIYISLELLDLKFMKVKWQISKWYPISMDLIYFYFSLIFPIHTSRILFLLMVKRLFWALNWKLNFSLYLHRVCANRCYFPSMLLLILNLYLFDNKQLINYY